MPSPDETADLLNGVLDLGINLIDTAPAYGVSEARIGESIAERRSEFVLCTKAGETFENGCSTFDFTSSGIRRSVRHSLRRLRTEVLDIVLLHSSGDDLAILNESDAAEALYDLREAGLVQAIGFSGKTLEGARAALGWADVVMVEYHLDDPSHGAVITEADAAGVGVLVKKGLASGRLGPAEAVGFVLSNPGVASMVVGGLDLDHFRANLVAAETALVADHGQSE